MSHEPQQAEAAVGASSPTPDAVITRREAIVGGALTLGAIGLGSAPGPGLAAAAQGMTFTESVPLTGSGAGPGEVFRTSRPFVLVGRIDLPAGGTKRTDAVMIRARPRGGAWTGWMPLRESPGHRPDRLRGPTASEPVWTGPAQEFQLKGPNTVAGPVRLLFVTETASAQPQGTATGGRAQPAGLPPAADATKLLAPQRPPMIMRSSWARGLRPRAASGTGQVRMAFVHHTVSASNYSRRESAGIVRSIAIFHIHGRGWYDIGYNFLVDRFGQVFEGRAGGIELAVDGAHAAGWNQLSTGIALIGEYDNHEPSKAALDSLAKLLAWKLNLHGVPAVGTVTLRSRGGGSNRWPRGRQVVFQRISGHRDGCWTGCPGNRLYRQLPALRTAVRAEAEAAKRPVLTITAPASAPSGSVVQINGLATNRAKQPLPLLAVELQVLDGSRWRRLATLRTSQQGVWSWDLELNADSTLRAAAVGTPSSPVTVTAIPIV